MKMRYQMSKIIPYFLSSFQPFKCVATIRKMTVENREMVEYVSPEGKVIQIQYYRELGECFLILQISNGITHYCFPSPYLPKQNT